MMRLFDLLPFDLLPVHSEGAKRLAWLVGVVSSLVAFIECFYLTDQIQMAGPAVPVAILIFVCIAIISFFVGGYIVIAITWVIEGFHRKNED